MSLEHWPFAQALSQARTRSVDAPEVAQSEYAELALHLGEQTQRIVSSLGVLQLLHTDLDKRIGEGKNSPTSRQILENPAGFMHLKLATPIVDFEHEGQIFQLSAAQNPIYSQSQDVVSCNGVGIRGYTPQGENFPIFLISHHPVEEVKYAIRPFGVPLNTEKRYGDPMQLNAALKMLTHIERGLTGFIPQRPMHVEMPSNVLVAFPRVTANPA